MSTVEEQSAHLDHLASVYSAERYPLYDTLAATSDPAGPLSLHELAGKMLNRRSRILDAGCRDAGHLIHLISAHQCTGVGIDPLPTHVTDAARRVSQRHLAQRIAIERGVIEHLPHGTASFDLVWCRDVLSLVSNLDGALSELARVLAPDGRIVVYINFATELMEPLEAERIHHALGNYGSNMNQLRFEAAISASGLEIIELREIGTEWREYEEERTKPISDDLLKLARLRRRRDEIVGAFGQDAYDSAEASLHWLCYQMLGKLKPCVYVLGHAGKA